MYQIGQTIAATALDAIIGEELHQPVWHCLSVIGGREARAKRQLGMAGIGVTFPVETRFWVRMGRKRERQCAMVPGLVYAKFSHAPRWHIIRGRRIITGVICRNGAPVIIPGPIIARIMGLPVDADRLAEAKADLLRIRPGDQARIMIGPLAGLVIDVAAITDKRVWWAGPLGRAAADTAAVERVLPSMVDMTRPDAQ